jgi:phosphatidylglycerol---prolipoprotein diacylglyceryl transferase
MSFTVCGLTGTGYGLAACAGVLVYVAAALLLRRKTQLPADAVLLGAVLGIPLGLLTSRLFFCAVNFRYYTQTIAQPLRMLNFWDGGFSMTGMLAGLVLAALLTARIRKLPFRTFLDAAVLPAGLLIFALRLGEGLTETLGVGRQVYADAAAQSLPFLFVTETMGTMELHRLAVYRYEAAFALLVSGATLWVYFKSKRRRDGDVTMLFFALYGAGQVLLESMRDDGHMVLGFIRVQQVLAILCPLAVLAVLCRRYGRLHGAKDAVTAAWAALPFAALILTMMVAPINHVLDLSGHITLGIGLLAPLLLYLAFFLRFKGANPRLILTWLAAIFTVAACVMLEFSMDGSASLLRDYALLTLCCAVLFLCPCTLWTTINRREGISR